MIVDVVRAYEGVLFGLVLVVLAAVGTRQPFSYVALGAVIVIPAALMVVFMHFGSPPRPLFLARVTGALVGWTLAWLLFYPAYIVAYLFAFPIGGSVGTLVLVAFLDGVLLGLLIALADWVRRRVRDRAALRAA